MEEASEGGKELSHCARGSGMDGYMNILRLHTELNTLPIQTSRYVVTREVLM
jgi:hypothetical protein